MGKRNISDGLSWHILTAVRLKHTARATDVCTYPRTQGKFGVAKLKDDASDFSLPTETALAPCVPVPGLDKETPRCADMTTDAHSKISARLLRRRVVS